MSTFLHFGAEGSLTNVQRQLLTNQDVISAKAPVTLAGLRQPAILLSLVVLAAVLRVYAISLYPLAGDEYGSLAEAKSIGVNWNSIIYSVLMNFWIRLGGSEFWLRLPSVILGCATVAILFKTGERFGGWRTGVVAALLAATSPFNIYHSQEVRFYSLFMFASAAFVFATICYVESRKGRRNPVALLATGVLLIFSHVFGILALYAQGAAAYLAGDSRRSRRSRMIAVLGVPLMIFGLLLVPSVQQALWRIAPFFYTRWDSVNPPATALSLLTAAKVGFTGYVFVFGYHIYPLRSIVVIGACISLLLLARGALRLWGSNPFRMLLLTYPLILAAIFLVIDPIGGRLSSGIAPRHVAFAWPAFLLVTAIGITAFQRPILHILMVSMLTVNAFAIWSGWQKDWSYGVTSDYRSAAEYASRWANDKTLLIHDGRSKDGIDFYFPQRISRAPFWQYAANRNPDEASRLILVTDDWQLSRRQDFDRKLNLLCQTHSIIDGRVAYPLFEYVLEPKSSSGYQLDPTSHQLQQPLSFYGLEFQDLQLPVAAEVKGTRLKVIGAYALPDSESRTALDLPLSQAATARRVVLLSNVVPASRLNSEAMIAEINLRTAAGQTLTLPVRIGEETASWNESCRASANCESFFRWRKRIAIMGQSSYPGAWSDFQAGLHAAAFDLPSPTELTGLSIRYLSPEGHLYIWGIAVL